jgi:hypothetical protein
MKKEQEVFLKELGITPGQSEFENVSTQDLLAEQTRLDVELKKLELQDRIETMASKKRKYEEKKREFDAKNQAVAAELGRRATRQRGCSHRKGGTTVAGSRDPLPMGGGDSDTYALVKFKLPNGDWWVTCQRCGAEWFPEDRFTGRPETVIGGISHSQVLMFKTDNTSGGASQFVLQDDRTPEQIERDRWHPPVDENGKEVPDFLALPLNHGQKLQPPPAVRASR